MYDLLIKNGNVIDPGQGINKKADIVIQGTKIAALAMEIPAKEVKQVIDASGKIVTPGLIDTHCHVYSDIHLLSTEPDKAGVRQAVTTVVDAGSAGYATFGGFPKYIVPSSQTTVYCFLHACSVGLSVVPELNDWSEIDTDATAAIVEAHRSLIKGIKLRLVGKLIAANGIEVFKKAKKIAKDNKLPIMVHIGDYDKRVPGTLTREFLPLMEPGDILVHIYTAQQGNILQPEKGVIPEIREAQKRGVIFDVAPGRMNFSFRAAEQCLSAGILPYIISSDVVGPSIIGPVYGLTAVMSRFLSLGFKLEQLVRMTTINPACVLGIDTTKGSLKPGMDADVSVLEVLSGKWDAIDAEGKTREMENLIMPRMCVKAGELIESKPVAMPALR